ncbi:Ferric/cupric reductase transmembrane component 2 [Tolypocladium capitatum]|uniref:Ferric/cupric reductase transmembrane component 2 n=1 Tax=Tolypocladium capitatum TaxID=45235 RepID=A0A2K3QNI6_9HYPO|nr:Ferric/cupric reductase transmembrane component 2 [Tolypocladium capitatum]
MDKSDPTPSLELRGALGPRDEVQPSSTIAPYYTALNGVNQNMNMLSKDVLWWSLGIVALVVLGIRFLEILWAKLRQVSAMSVPREKQGYWKVSQWGWMPSLKKHLIYAPLFRKRHNREFRLSSAVNVGTLPSRLHSILLFFYLASNIGYMLALNWALENKFALCAELRGRSGTLAIVNMVPLIIMAGRNNPLIPLLKISFDTYNLLHRWMGRIVVFEAVVHTVSWAIPAVADQGWGKAFASIFKSAFLGSGFSGTAAVMLLMLLSLSPIRHAFYETFLNVHIFLAAVVFACTWIHCDAATGGLPQLPWIMAVVPLWIADRAARVLRIVYANWSDRGTTDALCEAMPGDVTRVTVLLPRYVDIKPGTHAYLRFWGILPWESHPFSIAWVEHYASNALPKSEKEPLNDICRKTASTAVSFIIGAQTGMTRRLYGRACQSSSGVRLRAAMEGPYAGHHNLDSYGHVVLFAGSTGITHQISYLRTLLEGYNEGTVATRRLTLVWIIRTYESLEWVRPFMDTILRIPNRKDILRIQVFVTRPLNPRDIVSASSTVKMFPGRPNILLLLMKEVQDQIGAMVVSVCGPGGLADDVRGAVRTVQGDNVIDFIEESFTW